jgi:Mg-chelatase subunit ChlD
MAITSRDLRKKMRKGKNASLVVFVVDSSDSMGIRSQMGIAKGVIISLLAGAHKRDDKVSLITFRDRQASVVLSPTKSISLARDRLKKLPTGGTTPFAHGIVLAYNLIKKEKMKTRHGIPVMIILSDGGANVPYTPGEECGNEINMIGRIIRKEALHIYAIDTKPRGRISRQGMNMKSIARALGADYMHIDDIGVKTMVEMINTFSLNGIINFTKI